MKDDSSYNYKSHEPTWAWDCFNDFQAFFKTFLQLIWVDFQFLSQTPSPGSSQPSPLLTLAVIYCAQCMQCHVGIQTYSLLKISLTLTSVSCQRVGMDTNLKSHTYRISILFWRVLKQTYQLYVENKFFISIPDYPCINCLSRSPVTCLLWTQRGLWCDQPLSLPSQKQSALYSNLSLQRSCCHPLYV